jgi:hypothetical protein
MIGLNFLGQAFLRSQSSNGVSKPGGRLEKLPGMIYKNPSPGIIARAANLQGDIWHECD